jgi:alpha-galactosidase
MLKLDHCAAFEAGRQHQIVGQTLTGVADTPPMGWNSWNHYHCSVNEAILRNISKLFQATGVAAAGYAYVNIDDCWQAQLRDNNGTLQPDSRIFPSGNFLVFVVIIFSLLE